jgi:hypothetical protein
MCRKAAGWAVLVFLAGCAHQRAVPPPAVEAAPEVHPPAAAAGATSQAPSISPTPQTGAEPVAPSPGTRATQPQRAAQAKEQPPTAPPPAPGSAPAPRAGTAGGNASTVRNAGKPPAAVPAAAAASQPPPAVTERPGAPAQPALDLTSLEQRLRDTRAIGLFTKLSLKNQVDDLLTQFKAFHHGQSTVTLAELRQHFELLLLKVVSVLQDGDAQLAAAVSSSRDAIWAVLVDPVKFAEI